VGARPAKNDGMGCYTVAEFRLWPGGAQRFLTTAREVSGALGLAPGRGALRALVGDEDETEALWIARWHEPSAPAAVDGRLPAELQATLAASVAWGMGALWRPYAPVRTLERVLAPAAFCSAVRLRVAPQDGDRLSEEWLAPILDRATAYPSLGSVAALRALEDPGAFVVLAEWRAPVGPRLSRDLLTLMPPPVPLLAWSRAVGRIAHPWGRHASGSGAVLDVARAAATEGRATRGATTAALTGSSPD
jgi:hypothetical protein